MSFFKQLFRKSLTKLFLKKIHFNQKKIELHQFFDVYSKLLKRNVRFDLYIPSSYYDEQDKLYPVVWFNDGQDLPRMKFASIFENVTTKNDTSTFIAVGIYADENRMHEYGTSKQLDYKKRGNKSALYQQFLIEELMPFIRKRYRCSKAVSENAIAGFSLGALSAFDTAWHHSNIFGKIGVFSGSLWWRSKAFHEDGPDEDLIVHNMVKTSTKRDGQQYWLQAGTKDEDSDRNNNGIIDAIDDTLQLIDALKSIGYTDKEIHYEEVKNGEHNPDTWGEVMPDFLEWTMS